MGAFDIERWPLQTTDITVSKVFTNVLLRSRLRLVTVKPPWEPKAQTVAARSTTSGSNSLSVEQLQDLSADEIPD